PPNTKIPPLWGIFVFYDMGKIRTELLRLRGRIKQKSVAAGEKFLSSEISMEQESHPLRNLFIEIFNFTNK
ncbi:MAG: hypothetical protein WD471_01060, partial [Candidatus Paceibacterota bacterium]